MKKRRVVLIILCIAFIILFLIFLMRIFFPRQIDDVNPFMNCTSEQLERAQVYYVVPLFNNKPINESKEWCKKISEKNKTLYLHGIRHSYNEFGEEINEGDLDYAISIFEDCFGFKPTHFKPPQLNISKKNKELIKQKGLNLDLTLNQITHKVYHCNDSGLLSNKWIYWF